MENFNLLDLIATYLQSPTGMYTWQLVMRQLIYTATGLSRF